MIVTNIDELREHWPLDDSGRRARDLLLAFLTEKLVVTSSQNDCNPVSAQAEAAADKVFSSLIKDFRTLGFTPPAPITPSIKPLNRHITPKEQQQPKAS